MDPDPNARTGGGAIAVNIHIYCDLATTYLNKALTDTIGHPPVIIIWDLIDEFSEVWNMYHPSLSRTVPCSFPAPVPNSAEQ